MPPKYVIVKYLRLSLEDGDKLESDSIGNQRSLLDYHIRETFKNQPVEVIEIIDDGYSGTNMNRPGMKKLLILAETREINCIIVKDFSRFARDYIEVGRYAEQKFPEWLIRFISVNDRYDSNDFRGITGGIDMALKSIAYTMYSRDLSDKIKSSRRVQYKRGNFIAPYAFYGYLKSDEDKHKLVIDPVASQIVKKIFALRGSGVMPSKIAYLLNEEKILPPALYKKSIDPLCREWNNDIRYRYWSAGSVRYILQDERYTGKLISGKKERMTVGSNKTKRVAPDKVIVVENTHEAIISKEEFKAVQSLSQKRKNPKPSKVSLNSLVFCGGCKHRMAATNTKGKRIKFSCAYKKYTSENDCFQGKIDERDLAEFLIQTIQCELRKTVDISKAQKKATKLLQKNERAIEAIHGEMETQKKKKLAEYLKLTKNEITEEVFLKSKETLDKKMQQLSDELQKLQYQAMSKEEVSVLNLFGKYIDVEEINREVIQDLVRAIYIYPDKRIEIVWNFSETSLC